MPKMPPNDQHVARGDAARGRGNADDVTVLEGVAHGQSLFEDWMRMDGGPAGIKLEPVGIILE